jgi:hypothetical protein
MTRVGSQRHNKKRDYLPEPHYMAGICKDGMGFFPEEGTESLRILCRISGNSGLSAIVHKTRRAVN